MVGNEDGCSYKTFELAFLRDDYRPAQSRLLRAQYPKIGRRARSQLSLGCKKKIALVSRPEVAGKTAGSEKNVPKFHCLPKRNTRTTNKETLTVLFLRKKLSREEQDIRYMFIKLQSKCRCSRRSDEMHTGDPKRSSKASGRDKASLPQ